MVYPTGPSDPNVKRLANELRKDKRYAKLAKALLGPRRSQPEVDVSKIDAEAKPGEVVAIPGSVLAKGNISKSITVYARRFSASAADKIVSAGGKALPLEKLLTDKADARVLK